MPDSHVNHMDRVQNHVDLVSLLAERMGRLWHVTECQIEHLAARVKTTTILLLRFLKWGQRLVILLNEGCTMAVTNVIRVLIDFH